MMTALQAYAVAAFNHPWSEIEPSILGTVFERGCDPDNRGLSQYARLGIV